MKVTWDEPKRLANLDKHGLDFGAITLDFFMSALVVPVKLGRYKAIGRVGDVTVVAIFAPLGQEALSLISLRRANSKERTAYGD